MLFKHLPCPQIQGRFPNTTFLEKKKTNSDLPLLANTRQLRVHLLHVKGNQKRLPTSVSSKEPVKNITQARMLAHGSAGQLPTARSSWCCNLPSWRGGAVSGGGKGVSWGGCHLPNLSCASYSDGFSPTTLTKLLLLSDSASIHSVLRHNSAETSPGRAQVTLRRNKISKA